MHFETFARKVARAVGRLGGERRCHRIMRALHHATVVVTEGESYRMKKARSRGGSRRKTS
ncbi:MAG TPA: hypothetical protein VNO34_09985 [Actinomycetota bacterium]|nr:hypothetical protein [Actinomycetota bacterium]